MDTSEIRVFISYSRTDLSLVTPIVRMMRTIGRPVFQDVDSIPSGKRWRTVIENSIDMASIVFVFWCWHARGSLQVRKEWERAIQAKKDIVPTLLDDTPLLPSLAEYQAIDFRAIAASHAGGSGGDRNLLPGELERWKRRFLDHEQNNHMRPIDSGVVAKAAIQLLTFIEERSLRM